MKESEKEQEEKERGEKKHGTMKSTNDLSAAFDAVSAAVVLLFALLLLLCVFPITGAAEECISLILAANRTHTRCLRKRCERRRHRENINTPNEVSELLPY